MAPIPLTLMSATPTAIHAERCLLQRHQGASCKYCVDACKTNAILLGDGIISVNDDRCTGCGSCLSVCPVECFETSDWTERSLIATTERLGLDTYEFVCKSHPTPELGSEKQAILRVSACLAAISPGLWYELGQKYAVELRLEVCSDCIFGANARLIRQAIDLASNWLRSSGYEERLTIHEDVDTSRSIQSKRVISAENPTLNRRDFLFGFARSSGSVDQALSCLPTDQFEVEDNTKLRPHLPNWLRGLAMVYQVNPAQLQEVPAAGDQETDQEIKPCLWPTLSVANSCAACGACARYCPSGALSTAVRDNKFQHIFYPGACIGCGLCAKVCSTRALTRAYEPFEEPFTEHIMAERTVDACKKCGAPALNYYNGFCYWCATEAPVDSMLNNARGHLRQG